MGVGIMAIIISCRIRNGESKLLYKIIVYFEANILAAIKI
jgi:hypothetical protein